MLIEGGVINDCESSWATSNRPKVNRKQSELRQHKKVESCELVGQQSSLSLNSRFANQLANERNW